MRLTCKYVEPPIGIELMTYALRGCHRALLASSKPGLASCSQVADGGDRWQLMAVRGHVGDTGPQCAGHVLGGTALSNDLPLQAGHIPSWRRSCECYALWPVAAVSGWLLLLLSATADSEVRPGPRPQTLRPHQVKTPQAGPRSEDYLHPPCRLRASRISSAANTSDAHINQFCAPPPICPEAITAVQNGSSGAFQFDVHCLPFSLLVCLFPGVQPRKWPMRGTIT